MNGWETKALRAAGAVAAPAFAGAAFCLLALGIVTWLPALAAAACALQSWRQDGAGSCFTGTLRAFPRQWRALWRESLVATAAGAVLVANCAFLLGRGPLAFALVPVQVALLAALAVLCLARAVTRATGAGEGAAAGSRQGWAAAARLGFARPRRTLALLAVLVVAPVALLPVPLGPLLFGPTLPVLLALSLADPRPPVTPGRLAG